MDNTLNSSFLMYITKTDDLCNDSGHPEPRYQCNRKERYGSALISPFQRIVRMEKEGQGFLFLGIFKIIKVVLEPITRLGVVLKKWGEKENPGYPLREKLAFLKAQSKTERLTQDDALDLSGIVFFTSSCEDKFSLRALTEVLANDLKALPLSQKDELLEKDLEAAKRILNPLVSEMLTKCANQLEIDPAIFYQQSAVAYLQKIQKTDRFVAKWLTPFTEIVALFDPTLALPDQKQSKLFAQRTPEERKSCFQQQKEKIKNYVQTVTGSSSTIQEPLTTYFAQFEKVLDKIPQWERKSEIIRLSDQLESVYRKKIGNKMDEEGFA